MKHVAIALATAISLTSTAALASATLTGSYAVTEQYTSSHGGPTISDKLASSFSQGLTLGTATSPTNFFTASPDDSCSGGGCSGQTETDTLTINFSNVAVSGLAGTNTISFSDTAIFSAKYSGQILPCASGDGVSPNNGKTDCVIWSGAPNTYNGSYTDTENLGNGYDLNIIYYNATDWNVTPQISFELTQDAPTPTPEPASLVIVGTGLGMLGLLRRRSVRALR